VRSPGWQVALVLLGAPLIQAAFLLASGLDFMTFSKFAFVSGALMEYVVLWFVLRFLARRGDHLRDIGLRSDRWAREVVLGAGVGVLLVVFAGVASYFVEQVLPSTVSRDPRPPWAAWVYGFALVTAFAPIEEIVWRGYAITVLRERFGSLKIAVLLASAAFGLIHWWGGPATMLMSFVMGLAFSVLYLRRGTLIACISAHLVLDLPLFLFMLFPRPLPAQSHARPEIRAESAQFEAATAVCQASATGVEQRVESGEERADPTPRCALPLPGLRIVDVANHEIHIVGGDEDSALPALETTLHPAAAAMRLAMLDAALPEAGT
jgi:membrane protease YdiL (CAAX protease family)